MSNEKPKISEKKALKAVENILAYIGDDPHRPGLKDTPKRILAAWKTQWGIGYHIDKPLDLIRMFDLEKAISEPVPDQLVLVRDIEFWSHCEHHMAPFFGTATIGYVPGEKGIIGISKLARIANHYARQLQVQERLTGQIADFLAEHISPHCGVLMKATHLCMASRGANQPRAVTITSALRGNLFHDPRARQEFLDLARS